MKSRVMVLVLLCAASVGLGAQGGRGFGGPPADPVGKWIGTWNAYNPAQGATPPKEQCKTLTAEITREGEAWKGTTDLGAKDAGVFDWVGRADDKQFIGFYTSAYATGTFNLTRVP